LVPVNHRLGALSLDEGTKIRLAGYSNFTLGFVVGKKNEQKNYLRSKWSPKYFQLTQS